MKPVTEALLAGALLDQSAHVCAEETADAGADGFAEAALAEEVEETLPADGVVEATDAEELSQSDHT